MDIDTGVIREFSTGATRDSGQGKLAFEGFLSPRVLRRYAQFMHKHRQQTDGSLRDADNWQKGIPLNVYMDSGFRHFVDWWASHRGLQTDDPAGQEDAICAVLFNAMGYLHELLKAKEKTQ